MQDKALRLDIASLCRDSGISYCILGASLFILGA